jgi:uncharacterized protein YigE (DUF2233 family)
MKRIVVLTSLFCLLITITGCDFEQNSDVWKKVHDDLSYMNWNFTVGDSKENIIIYKINPEQFNIKILNSEKDPKYVSDWLYENDSAEIVINGGYFHEDFSPSGYLKVNFERVGERLFDQNLSGLVEIENNKLTLRDLKTNPLKDGENIEYGLQSYPFLIKNSLPAVADDTEKTARRTALGLDQEGNIYIIVADASHISLYGFMNEIIKTKIPFTNVLNLDGGTSTGVAVSYGNFSDIKDSLVKVPNVIVFDKI